MRGSAPRRRFAGDGDAYRFVDADGPGVHQVQVGQIAGDQRPARGRRRGLLGVGGDGTGLIDRIAQRAMLRSEVLADPLR